MEDNGMAGLDNTLSHHELVSGSHRTDSASCHTLGLWGAETSSAWLNFIDYLIANKLILFKVFKTVQNHTEIC